jgi:hypothetical protein
MNPGRRKRRGSQSLSHSRLLQAGRWGVGGLGSRLAGPVRVRVRPLFEFTVQDKQRRKTWASAGSATGLKAGSHPNGTRWRGEVAGDKRLDGTGSTSRSPLFVRLTVIAGGLAPYAVLRSAKPTAAPTMATFKRTAKPSSLGRKCNEWRTVFFSLRVTLISSMFLDC